MGGALAERAIVPTRCRTEPIPRSLAVSEQEKMRFRRPRRVADVEGV